MNQGEKNMGDEMETWIIHWCIGAKVSKNSGSFSGNLYDEACSLFGGL